VTTSRLDRGGDEQMRRMATTSAGIFADHRLSEQDLVDLLDALRARATSHPDNPGLIACWPAVPEHWMAVGCRELRRRGHPICSMSIGGWAPGKRRNGWAVAPVAQPSCKPSGRAGMPSAGPTTAEASTPAPPRVATVR
jgi:hypothetical protein